LLNYCILPGLASRDIIMLLFSCCSDSFFRFYSSSQRYK
jgi:hypothetical protein